MTKAVLYARVSSVEQKKEGYSIPAQIELLKTDESLPMYAIN